MIQFLYRILNKEGNIMAVEKINEKYDELVNELEEKLANKSITETAYYEHLKQINHAYNMDLSDDYLSELVD